MKIWKKFYKWLKPRNQSEISQSNIILPNPEDSEDITKYHLELLRDGYLKWLEQQQKMEK